MNILLQKYFIFWHIFRFWLKQSNNLFYSDVFKSDKSKVILSADDIDTNIINRKVLSL